MNDRALPRPDLHGEEHREAARAGAHQHSEIGTFVAVADIALAEALASSFDVLVIDLEHGALDIGQAQALCMAIQARGAFALVRAASATDPRLAAILDSGVDGVVAPMIESQEQATMFAQRTRYPPSGRRGFGPRRAGNYGRGSPQQEAGPICAVQIETDAGVLAASEIAAVDGVDLIILGCSDLALSYGIPGEFESAEIRNAIRSTAAAADQAEVRFGLAAGGGIGRLPEVAPVPLDLLLHSVDLRMYMSAADSTAIALRRALARMTPTGPGGVGGPGERSSEATETRSGA